MLDIPPDLVNPEVVSVYIQCFEAVLKKDLGPLEAACPSSQEDERSKHPWWKAKTVCASTLHRILQRYGNPQFPHANCKDFAKWFLSNFGPTISSTISEQLVKSRTNWTAEKVMVSYLAWMDNAIKHSTTRDLMMPPTCDPATTHL